MIFVPGTKLFPGTNKSPETFCLNNRQGLISLLVPTDEQDPISGSGTFCMTYPGGFKAR